MRIFTLLKKAFTKLGLISDYVVEQGTSGIWTYRKWNSGGIKLIGHEQFVSGTWAGGSVLYYGVYRYVSLPSIVKTAEFVSFSPESAGGGVIMPGLQQCTDDGRVYVYYLRAYGGNGSVTINHSIYVIGTWK